MNLAVILAETDELAEATELAESILPKAVSVLGPDHPDTLRWAGNTSLMHRASRRPGLLTDDTALERLAQRVGPDHPEVQALRDGRYLHRVIDPNPF